jgi:hypothetical protein
VSRIPTLARLNFLQYINKLQNGATFPGPPPSSPIRLVGALVRRIVAKMTGLTLAVKAFFHYGIEITYYFPEGRNLLTRG